MEQQWGFEKSMHGNGDLYWAWAPSFLLETENFEVCVRNNEQRELFQSPGRLICVLDFVFSICRHSPLELVLGFRGPRIQWCD
eukprot:182671-Rhodomonas_salina.2